MVERSGRATISSKLDSPRTVQVSPRALKRLEDALERADFEILRSSYRGNNFPDAFYDAITYRDKTVRGGQLPPELGPPVSILLGLVHR